MDNQNLITFAMNIPDKIGHQITVYIPILPNVRFCTTWGKQNKQKNTCLFNSV